MPLSNLPPDAIEFLKNHESNDEHDILLDPSKLVLDLTDPTTQSLLANANRAAELEARERKLKADEARASAKDAFRRAKARSVPQKIGLTGIDPRSGFDCRFDPFTRILWVPVMIYSVPLPPSNPLKRTNPYTNTPILQVGQTSIQQSTVTIPFTRPDGSTVERTIKGFCILELSDYSPEETMTLLEQKLGPLTAADDDEPSFNEPAFIPSLQPPTPESRTDQARTSPHTSTGASTKPTPAPRTTPTPLHPDCPPFDLPTTST